MSERVWRVKPEIMSEVLDGEAVIIDLASGRYHGAPGVGATVWQAISAGSSLDGIVGEVARLHGPVPPDAVEQVTHFIDLLVASGLIVEGDGAASTPQFAGTSGSPWSTPVLESHDDLQDLLLLDPVHDVTEDGWPHAAPAS
jgi:hypothetical protein